MGLTDQDLQEIWNNCFIENFMHEMLGVLKYIEQADPLKTVVEIGTGLGGSARIWEKVVPSEKGMVIGVDILADIADRWSGKIENYTTCSPCRVGNWEIEWQRNNVIKFKSDRQIYVVIGDSSKKSTADTVKSILGARYADFIFHDGSHWGHGACWDYHWFQHLLRTNGLLCVADLSQMGEDPMSGCQALFRGLPEPKKALLGGNLQGMGLWNKQKDFVFDAEKVIKTFNVAAYSELDTRRAALSK